MVMVSVNIHISSNNKHDIYIHQYIIKATNKYYANKCLNQKQSILEQLNKKRLRKKTIQ